VPPEVIRRDVELRYSSAGLDAQARLPLPSPLVRGAIAGHAVTMILDTGAHIPVVTASAARDAGLSVGPAIRGRDAAGRSVLMRRFDRAPLSIDGWGAIPDQPMAIADLPEAFGRIGIGAIVSPQALVVTPDDVVVLDLVAGRMRFMTVREAPPVESTARDRFALSDARICAYESDGLHARSLVATVTIDGTDVLLDLDTGTNGVTVGLGTEVGRRLVKRPSARRSHGFGAAGGFDAVLVDGVAIRLGTLEASATVSVVYGAASAACRTAGRLGMDFLRGCVLVIGEHLLSVSCRPPSISTGKPLCDECMRTACPEPSAACQSAPARCGAFGECAKACANRACIDDCGSRSPEGMALNLCLREHCKDACAP
jgi:hypothetical protein